MIFFVSFSFLFFFVVVIVRFLLLKLMKMMTTTAGVSGAGMLRTRRRDCSVKPNRKLDRKSSRGMIYENEELRLRTIHINAEVEQGKGFMILSDYCVGKC